MVGLLAIAILSPQAMGVKEDPKLQKLVTLNVVDMPLPEVLPALSKEAGILAKTVPNLDDLKVTVLVKGVKAGVVMDKIASVIGGEWGFDNDTYRLRISNESNNHRTRYLSAEDRYLRSKAEKQAKGMIDRARNELHRVMAEMRQQNGAPGTGPNGMPQPRVGGGTPPPPQPQGNRVPPGGQRTATNNGVMSGTMANRPAIAIDIENIAVGNFLSNLRPDQARQLWEGRVVAYPVELPGGGGGTRQLGALRYSALSGSLKSSSSRTYQWTAGENTVLHEQQFDFKVAADSNSPRQVQEATVRFTGRTFEPLIALPRPVDSLIEEPFAKEVLGWEKEESPDPRSLIDTPKGLSIPGGNPPKTLGEALRWVHTATGAPIVADAFRAPIPNVATSASTAREAVKALSRALRGYVRIEDQVLAVRHGGFWRRRQYEVPEAAAKRLEKSKATMEDWLTFASALKPSHWQAFEASDGPLLKVDSSSFGMSAPLIRFLAQVGPGVRSSLYNGQGIPASQTGSGADLAMQLVMGSTFFGGQRIGQGFRLDGPPLGVFGRMGPNGNIQVVFGASPQDGIRYSWEPK